MASLKVGDSLPSDVVFSYIPYTEESSEITACGIPINYNASKGTWSSPVSYFFSSVSRHRSSNLPSHLSQTPLLPCSRNQADRDCNTEWANKKVVLFAVPGAFTPSCSVSHLPGYVQNLPAIKAKGVDVVAVIAYNDAFVMSAWSKANGIKNDDIVRPSTFPT
jgi:alkyl hydroperoxide reductase 1